MKSIIFTVTNDLTHDRRMLRISDSLQQHGFNVTIIGRQLPHSAPLPAHSFKTLRLRCIFNKGKLFYIEYNVRLFFKLLSTQADIYAAVDLDTIIPAFKVAWLKGKKKVFDAHEYFEEVPEVVHRPVTKAIWRWVGKLFVPRADLAITVSESLAEQFQKLYGIRFETIRNVPQQYKDPVFQRGTYLLYQGALNEGRGLEQIIEAMQSLNMKLIIAGEGDLSHALREKVKALGLEKRIEFFGMLHPERLSDLTAAAWLGLNLLEHKGQSYYYSLANKFFDYINHGVPSLNMDFPEYRRINSEFEVSMRIKELTPQRIIDAVKLLQQHPGVYERLRANCIAARAKYNWENEEQKLFKLYSRFE